MTEREKAAAYLRMLADEWPSEGFCERMLDKGLMITPEIIKLGKSIILASATQIEDGAHVRWAKETGQ